MGEIPCSLKNVEVRHSRIEGLREVDFCHLSTCWWTKNFSTRARQRALAHHFLKKNAQQTNGEYRPPKTRKWMVYNFPKCSFQVPAVSAVSFLKARNTKHSYQIPWKKQKLMAFNQTPSFQGRSKPVIATSYADSLLNHRQ